MKKQSAKQKLIQYVKQKILSGEYKVDQKLPAERDLAEQTGISRIIVHAGLVELATKNVLRIVPRQGTYVNDFKKEGTLELYGDILQFTGTVDKELLCQLMEYREIIEVAAAKLAAKNRSLENIECLRNLLEQETKDLSSDEVTRLDYEMHLEIAKASCNTMLPMTLRSIEIMYKHIVKEFYEKITDRSIVNTFHQEIVVAIEKGNSRQAGQIMKKMLNHGQKVLDIDSKY